MYAKFFATNLYYQCAGGYAEYIYRVAASELFGVQLPEGPLPFKAIRNTDFKEICLEVPSHPHSTFQRLQRDAAGLKI